MDPLDNMHTIERAVYTMISLCLDISAKESIEISGRAFDFFLPNGVKKLNWPENTYIDVKYRMAYDSITRIRESYDIIKSVIEKN